jgi:predicted short-subunit dehydrogenase-like oxidoreductase (DUF2520 family)
MRISILGAGNVATNLALAFKKAGHTIVEIYNRSDDAGQELARTVAASFTSDIQRLQDADIYIIAVKDDAIEERAGQLRVNNRIVAHTSGTKTIRLLAGSSSAFGIFYPLQTMKKSSKVDFRNVPLLIEGNNEYTANALSELARSISQNVHLVDEEQRQWIHVAAVFANNFTNHLFAQSEKILVSHGLSFEILKPLILSFVQNLQTHSPAELQTGPAIRGDRNTIDQHLHLLSNDQHLRSIYETLTNSIMASVSPNHK